MSSNSSSHRSYAGFGLRRSLRQIRDALSQNMSVHVQTVIDRTHRDESRIARQLGTPVTDLRILEIGPGQSMARARYLGIRNSVTALDLDVIPRGFDPLGYLQMARHNGFGRVLKTAGRKLLGVDRRETAAMHRILGTTILRDPEFIQGDICRSAIEGRQFDLATSWSVFEHLPDPRQALCNVLSSLRPGGLFYFSIHLFTAINGHHDIRACTGEQDQLPIWGHLRTSTRHQFQRDTYLNEWRLQQWRDLFDELAPGYQEFRQTYDTEQLHDLSSIRNELTDYTDEELFTVDVIFLGTKP